MLDLVNATFTFKSKEKQLIIHTKIMKKDTYLSKQLSFSDENVTNLYYELYEYLMSMGEDVQFKELKFYLAFKRIKTLLVLKFFLINKDFYFTSK